MPELRWTLLIVGALFIVGLALWEFRRQRQAPRQSSNAGAHAGSERLAPTLEGGIGESARLHREPIITLPELHPEPRPEPRLTARREPAHDPPIVEVDEASFSRLDVEGETGTSDALGDEIAARYADAVTMRLEAAEAARLEGADPTAASDAAAADLDRAASASDDVARAHAAAGGLSTPSPQGGGLSQVATTAESSTGFVSDADEPDIQPSEASQSRSAGTNASEAHPAGASADGAPIVDWPSEESRKIVALRLVSSPAARFSGRAVRQALAAEGFVLGKFDIFHKAGPDDRCMLSAASLTKPGTFAMNTIDAQRFGGISLFAVLPGPLPPQQTFDELLSTARNLNNRLQGALQDERGEPLTPMRSASIRQSLAEGNGSHGSGAGAAPQSEIRQ